MHRDFEKYNPFRVPEWRHLRASYLASKKPRAGRPSKNDDKCVRDLRGFLTKFDAIKTPEDRSSLFIANPGLFYAHMIQHHPDETMRNMVQARLLSRQENIEIAECIGTVESAIEWYERCYFNVRDRFINRDWVNMNVLGPSALRGIAERPDDFTAKIFGYYCGPMVMELVLHGYMPGEVWPENAEEVDEFLVMHFKRGVARRMAMTVDKIEINRYNFTEISHVHTKLLELEKAQQIGAGSSISYEQNVLAVLASVKMVCGDTSREADKHTPLTPYEDMAADLRADEQVMVCAGQIPAYLEDLRHETLPLPRRPEDAGHQQEG